MGPNPDNTEVSSLICTPQAHTVKVSTDLSLSSLAPKTMTSVLSLFDWRNVWIIPLVICLMHCPRESIGYIYMRVICVHVI